MLSQSIPDKSESTSDYAYTMAITGEEESSEKESSKEESSDKEDVDIADY